MLFKQRFVKVLENIERETEAILKEVQDIDVLKRQRVSLLNEKYDVEGLEFLHRLIREKEIPLLNKTRSQIDFLLSKKAQIRRLVSRENANYNARFEFITNAMFELNSKMRDLAELLTLELKSDAVPQFRNYYYEEAEIKKEIYSIVKRILVSDKVFYSLKKKAAAFTANLDLGIYKTIALTLAGAAAIAIIAIQSSRLEQKTSAAQAEQLKQAQQTQQIKIQVKIPPQQTVQQNVQERWKNPYHPEDNFRDDDPVTLLARCIYGEARGASRDAKIAVGCIVMNRLKDGGWFGSNIYDVILKPYQFSCFNKNDVNFRIIKNPLRYGSNEWFECVEIAKQALGRKMPDITKGARFYYDSSIRAPGWVKGKKQTAIIICSRGKYFYFYA